MKIRWMCNMIAVSLTCCTCFLYSVEATPQTGEIAKIEQTVSSVAKDKVMLALVDFMELSKDTLQEGIEATKYGAVEAGKFAKVQIPIVLQELIILRRTEVIAYLLCLVFVAIVVHILASKSWKQAQSMKPPGSSSYDPTRDFFITMSIILRIVFLVVPVVVFLCNVRSWILPWFAPRIYLIEYAIDIIKNVS